MAARVVARENAVLRNLVRERTGCNEQQLNSYLSLALQAIPERSVETRALGHGLPRIETSPSILLLADKKESPVAEGCLEPDCAPRHNPPGSAAPNPEPRPRISGGRRCHGNTIPHIPSDKILADLGGSESPATGEDMTDLESHSSFDSGSRGASGNPLLDFDRQQGASMSCEEAAAIISSISIMDGSRNIREQLGCTSVRTCNVYNIEVFQVMGDAI